MPTSSAYFPDALVLTPPVVADVVHKLPDMGPEFVRYRRTVAVEDVNRVDQLAIDVELELTVGVVADADGSGTPVALEVVEGLLEYLLATVQTVDELKRAVRVEITTARLDP